jgi:hypothetical protein
MDTGNARGEARVTGVWRWVVGAAAVAGALWLGLAVYDGGGRGSGARPGTTVGEAGAGMGRQGTTTGMPPVAAATLRPPLDRAETPAVETASFALG